MFESDVDTGNLTKLTTISIFAQICPFLRPFQYQDFTHDDGFGHTYYSCEQTVIVYQNQGKRWFPF